MSIPIKDRNRKANRNRRDQEDMKSIHRRTVEKKKISFTQITMMMWSLTQSPDSMECEVKWALRNTTVNKASGGNGIPVELFKIPKDDAIEVLFSLCQ